MIVKLRAFRFQSLGVRIAPHSLSLKADQPLAEPSPLAEPPVRLLVIFVVDNLTSSLSIEPVKLRDHPLLSYRGIASWPPVWINIRDFEAKKLTGEIGVLTHALLHDDVPTKCFLAIEFERVQYMGSVIFEDPAFCRQIHALLQPHIGRSIKEIGSLDLSYTL